MMLNRAPGDKKKRHRQTLSYLEYVHVSNNERSRLRNVTKQLENFSMNKAVPGERRRGNQSHEKSLCILRLCIVSWTSSGIP